MNTQYIRNSTKITKIFISSRREKSKSISILKMPFSISTGKKKSNFTFVLSITYKIFPKESLMNHKEVNQIKNLLQANVNVEVLI